MTLISAPGKMILLGEYAVLEGSPALVYAVNRRARVAVNRIPGGEFRVSAPSLLVPSQPFVCTTKKKVRFDPNLESHIRNRLLFFKSLFENLMVKLNLCSTDQALAIELVTDAFYDKGLHRKLGFGSSSAMTVALTKAFSLELSLDVPEKEIFNLAMDTHHAAQGNVGSGIDIAASVFGGTLEYRRNGTESDSQKLEIWQDLNLAVIWSGQSASTTRMVQSVKELQLNNADLYKAHMDKLSDLSAEGIQAYRKKETKDFLKTINNFYRQMQALGEDSHTDIISSAHQELAQIAQNSGAAYKPSGAGGGDIGLLFTENPKQLADLSAQIRQAGYGIIDVELDKNGVILENQN